MKRGLHDTALRAPSVSIAGKQSVTKGGSGYPREAGILPIVPGVVLQDMLNRLGSGNQQCHSGTGLDTRDGSKSCPSFKRSERIGAHRPQELERAFL